MLEKFIDNDVMGFERVLRDIEKILLLIYTLCNRCCPTERYIKTVRIPGDLWWPTAYKEHWTWSTKMVATSKFYYACVIQYYTDQWVGPTDLNDMDRARHTNE